MTYYINISDDNFYEIGTESMGIFYGEKEFDIIDEIVNSCSADKQQKALDVKCIVDDANKKYSIAEFLNKLETFKGVRLQK